MKGRRSRNGNHATRAAERESERAVLSSKDPGRLGRGGAADGSTGLGRGSVACTEARRTRTPDARPSRLADGWPDLAVRAGDGAGLPRAGLAALVGPEGRPVAALTAQPPIWTRRRPAL